MATYKGTVTLVSGLTQKNNGTFPLVDASAVNLDLANAGNNADRLDNYLKNVAATKQYVIDSVSTLEGALVFKGTVNSNADLPSSEYKVGWTYWVNAAGIYKGQTCEKGDMIICIATNGANADWSVAQTNIDGAITDVSQNSPVADDIVVFTGTGSNAKDSGVKYSDLARKTDTVLNTTLSRGRSGTVGEGSFAFGDGATASGYYSHAEGESTASGYCSHSEGLATASGDNAHAEGDEALASGEASHAENYAQATGDYSHAEGDHTLAAGRASHAEGIGTKASRAYHHVFGKYNTDDTTGENASRTGTYVEIVGNGVSNLVRSNARTLDWDGNERLKGNIYIGCNDDSTGGTLVATMQDISTATADISDESIDAAFEAIFG